MKDSLQLPAAQWNFFQVLEQAHYRLDIVILELLAKRVQVSHVFLLFVIADLKV